MSDGLPGTNLLVCQSHIDCNDIICARPWDALLFSFSCENDGKEALGKLHWIAQHFCSFLICIRR